VRIELIFEWNTACQKRFQRGENHILFQIGLLSSIEETHVSLKRKASMLEAGESSMLFASKN
jgi:hypothetical protein